MIIKKALIIGTSPSIWDDLNRFEEILNYKDVHICLVNYAACMFLREKAQYLITLHPELIPSFRKLRRNKSREYLISYSQHESEGVDFVMPLENHQYGYSGYYAARVLAEVGYEKIIMAGCGCTNDGHIYDDPALPAKGKTKHGETVTLSQLDHYKHELKDKLRSLSGNTRLIFGYPDKDWLNEELSNGC